MGWKGLVSLSLHYETPLCFVDPGKVGCKNHSLVWALLPLTHTHTHTHTDTYMRTHTHAYIHAHIHAHTPLKALSLQSLCAYVSKCVIYSDGHKHTCKCLSFWAFILCALSKMFAFVGGI